MRQDSRHMPINGSICENFERPTGGRIGAADRLRAAVSDVFVTFAQPCCSWYVERMVLNRDSYNPKSGYL